MKVLLVNPPLSFPNFIYSAIPLLLGQLKYNNIDAEAIDMNVEFLKDITSKEYLVKTKQNIEQMYEHRISQNTSFEDFLGQNQAIKNCLSQQQVLNRIINNADNIFSNYINMKNNGLDKKIITLMDFAIKFAFLPFSKIKTKLNYLDNKAPYILEKTQFPLNAANLEEYCNNPLKNIYICYFKNKIKEINANQYDIIAITIPFETNLAPALTLGKILKEYTNAKVVFGGIIPTSVVDSFIKYPSWFGKYFDELLIGEGELSILQYVKYVEKKLSVSNISGLIYKENDKIVKNNINFIDKIEVIKPPCYDGINFNNYSFPIISLEFSKGCYWSRCIYCYSSAHKRYHIKHPIKAVDIIEQLIEKYNIRNFDIFDDALSPNFLEKFAEELIKRKLKIRYTCFLRFENILRFKLLDKAYKSGLEAIFWGLESASTKILKLMDKGIKPQITERILKDCYQIGIKSHVGVILGFPEETEKDLLETLNFIEKNKKYITLVDTFHFSLLKSSNINKCVEILKLKNICETEEFGAYLSFDKIETIKKKRFDEILKQYGIQISPIYSKW